MSEAAALLKSIPELVAARDAARLGALRDHPDKDVRKAVRKALHTLKSKGIDVPEAGGKSWTLGQGLQSLRGELHPIATIDAASMPGALRFVLSIPDEDGAKLFTGALGPDDRVLDFHAYRQTDGQRTRMLRDWDKGHGDRELPVSWLAARIRWARDNTIAGGFSVPRSLDEALVLLGETPSVRPPSFLAERVADQPAFAPSEVESVLAGARVDLWPPLVNLDGMLQRAAEIHGDAPQPTDDDARVALIAKAAVGDAEIRKGLQGPIANALLSLVAAVAPLAGLLGTVNGMITTFSVVTDKGTSDAQQLAGGISEALLTTQFGLTIAIPALVAHALLNRGARRVLVAIEQAVLQHIHGIAHGDDGDHDHDHDHDHGHGHG
ncbi:MAG: MotA/TolQ/ExbB proton channel family protein [Nannocystaceae bacterium]